MSFTELEIKCIVSLIWGSFKKDSIVIVVLVYNLVCCHVDEVRTALKWADGKVLKAEIDKEVCLSVCVVSICNWIYLTVRGIAWA